MLLTLHLDTQHATQTVKDEVAALLSTALARFTKHIRHVMVSVHDVNGPRGGIDKQCRCVLHLKGMAPIVIQDQDDSIDSMLLRVANRGAYALSQRLDRNQTSYRTRRRQTRQPLDDQPQEVATELHSALI